MEREIDVLKSIARGVGQIHTRYFNKTDLEIQSKSSPHDLLTKADLESDKYLRQRFTEEFPLYGIITEEGVSIPSKNGKWLCADPLDGTANFASGLPHFSVSIGILDDDHQPLCGVVFDPNRNEMFWGIKGSGSYVENKKGLRKLHCSNKKELKGSVWSTVLVEFDKPNLNNVDETELLMSYGAEIVCRGSSCLDLCYVADGRTDGYYMLGPHIWDFAAGWVIAEEAGAVFTRYDGKRFSRATLHFPKLTGVCAPPELHSEMIQAIRCFPVMKIFNLDQ